ncbi:MAG: ABC transporter permease [Patescibacteria group bacterium]|jgi:putative ABC transport system permease protein|nr:ABC transporter permease [bacterium]HQC49553.1 ABC transporter permease [bacterium]
MNNYFKKIKIALSLAWNSLRRNLLRTSLTILGVVIGVTSIVIVFSAGAGVRQLVLWEVESYGSDLIQTEVKVPTSDNVATEITTLKISDMEAVNRLNNIKRSYAASLGQQRVTYENQSRRVFIYGVGSDYQYVVRRATMEEGNFYTEGDDKTQAQVVVLGNKLKADLFGDQPALGKFVKIGTKKFKVVGVLTEQGSYGFMNFNDFIYMPVTTLIKKIQGIDYIMYFTSQLNDVSRADETAEEIRQVLRERHDINDPLQDDFRVSTMDEIIEIFNTVTNAITFLLFAIVLISLLVGGVGIMNIMYVTVTERTPEIGLRKALGATKIDIILQFLIESVMITFWGWILGVVFGLIGSYGLALVANRIGIHWRFFFPTQGVLVSLLFSIGCGLLFGLRPAKQAAKLDPITALRVEQ